MLRVNLPLAPLAALCAAGTLLLSADPSHGQTLPTPQTLSAVAAPINTVAVNLETVLRLTFQRNADILTARERVNESQIALDAAMASCIPEMLRKDTFKKPVAEATVWRRRVELRKNENDILQDASNTYFDWLTTVRGEVIARDLIQYEEKLLVRARKLAKDEKPVQVVVEAIETAVSGRQQYILHIHQQSEALAAKLMYLMGMNGGAITPAETLQPINRVDTSVSVEGLVRQAQENGPTVRELQGLIASIQQSIDKARFAQCICSLSDATRVCERLNPVHAPLTCGHLQMAQSQLQQAASSLYSVQVKLRAGVEDAFTAVASGREEIDLAAKAIDHAAETYRIMDLRLSEENPKEAMNNKTYDGVLNSIRQFSQADNNYLTAVRDYNKAQGRLLLMIGTYSDCPSNAP
ncbi:MAG: TolC family protein [Gemmataceae bacterium]